ncbi:MAG: CHASE2 domain-containing protein [Candidatus Binatia bacterium]
MWQRLSSFRIAVLLGIMLSLLRFHGCRYLDLIDLRARDYRLLHRGAQQGSSDIVIVAVDDASLEQFGRWPWSRARVAELIDRLTEADVAVIGFDIIQSERAADADLDTLRDRLVGIDDHTWEVLRRALNQGAVDEERLAQAVRASGRTVLGYFFDFEERVANDDSVRLPTYNIVQNSRSHDGEIRVPLAQRLKSNLPELTAAARAVGYFNFFPDDDGTHRRAPLVIRFKDQMALPLSLAMLQVYRPQVPLVIRFADFGVESVHFGSESIPVAEDGQMFINYRGPRNTFRYVSAADVLTRHVESDLLRGKMVLVGVTATAVADVRVTPFDPSLPGVEIHANVLDNILRRDFLTRPEWSVLAEIGVILSLALFLGGILHSARGVSGAVITVALLAAYLVLSQRVFLSYGLPLSLAYPFLAIGLTHAVVSLQHYVVEEREKRKIRDAFGLYLSPSLARLVSEQPEMLALGGDKRELTVMFADIRDFTTIAEGLEPEVLVDLLNAFLGEMTEVIFAHDGMLDKYVGDAIMAVWGAPLPQADHAARACRAALEMVGRLHILNQQWNQRGWPALKIGVGLNTGSMVVGNMGSARRLSYTVIGDNVNLGSRLEGLNKMYGSHIIASEATILAVANTVVARELDLVRVKGRRLPVRIFEIVGPGDERAAWAPMLERFATGIAAYRQRRWDDAIAAFRSVLEIQADDGAAQLYLKRCRDMLVSPPDLQWDGVTAIDMK